MPPSSGSHLWVTTPTGGCILDLLHIRYLQYSLQQQQDHSYEGAMKLFRGWGHHSIKSHSIRGMRTAALLRAGQDQGRRASLAVRVGGEEADDGLSPQNLVRWCDSAPCKNGGKCWQTNTQYHCECRSGWTGFNCDVLSVSCEVAAQKRGDWPSPSVLALPGSAQARPTWSGGRGQE